METIADKAETIMLQIQIPRLSLAILALEAEVEGKTIDTLLEEMVADYAVSFLEDTSWRKPAADKVLRVVPT